MDCAFECPNRIESPTLPICKLHLEKLGLKLSLFGMESLVDSPAGLGPFLSTIPDKKLPRLFFNMGLPGTESYLRALYLPTFKKNDVIIHALEFKHFLGEQQDCAVVSAINVPELLKLAESDRKSKLAESIGTEQAEAIKILSTSSAAPQASRFLVRLLKENQSALRTSAFSTKDTAADKIPIASNLLTIVYPKYFTDIMAAKHKDFDVLNTVWAGVIYSLFPETITYETNFKMVAGANCKMEKEKGLVATRDIFVGEPLILQGKEMKLKDIMCHLPPPMKSIFNF